MGQCPMYTYSIIKVQLRIERMINMKGYVVSQGYMGYVDGGYRLFPSEAEYVEYMEED